MIRKLLSIRLARDDDFDVNYHFFPGHPMRTWLAVDALSNPHQGRTRRRPFMTRGDTRVHPVRDAPMSLECTHVYLTAFDASTQSSTFRPHHQNDKLGRQPRSSPYTELNTSSTSVKYSLLP